MRCRVVGGEVDQNGRNPWENPEVRGIPLALLTPDRRGEKLEKHILGALTLEVGVKIENLVRDGAGA